MNQVLADYDCSPQWVRLAWATLPIVILSGLYCLAYRYSAGDPATLVEAFSWGLINLAPWAAAIELGRHAQSRWHVVVTIILAFAISLALEAAFAWRAPDMFEVWRRVPALLLTITVLVALARFGELRKRRQAADAMPSTGMSFDWARAAGNYCELYLGMEAPRLVRSTIASLCAARAADAVRIHRSYVVSRDAILRIERNHILLKSGKRLPIGHAYRADLAAA